MKTTKLITMTGAAIVSFCALAATFDSIPFDTPTFSTEDPLGVSALT